MKKAKMNMFDFAIIILILLLAFATYTKFNNYNAEDGTNVVSQKIQYDLEIKNIREHTVNAFELGQKVYDSQTDVEIGYIIEKKVSNSTSYEKIESGKIVKVEIPDKYDLTLVIETDGIENQNGYYANKTVELKVGSEKTIETLYAKTMGKIKNIVTHINQEESSGDVL